MSEFWHLRLLYAEPESVVISWNSRLFQWHQGNDCCDCCMLPTRQKHKELWFSYGAVVFVSMQSFRPTIQDQEPSWFIIYDFRSLSYVPHLFPSFFQYLQSIFPLLSGAFSILCHRQFNSPIHLSSFTLMGDGCLGILWMMTFLDHFSSKVLEPLSKCLHLAHCFSPFIIYPSSYPPTLFQMYPPPPLTFGYKSCIGQVFNKAFCLVLL